MAEVLVPADVEVAVGDELNARLPDIAGFEDVRTGTRIPSDTPEEFVRVTATGGAERDMVTDSPTVFVEGFAVIEGRAERVAAHAVAVLQAAGRDGSVGGVPCYRVRVLSLPQNLPLSTLPDRFRFRATVSLDLRRSTV